MPDWGYACVGIVVLIAIAGASFWVFAVIPFEKRKARLMEHGQPVVAKIMMAVDSLYEKSKFPGFEGALVVFTLDDDCSERHLEYLTQVCNNLERFKPKQDAGPDAKKIALAIKTQKTVGSMALRVPKSLTEGREVYFASEIIDRDLLPKGKLTEEFIYMQVYIEGDIRDCAMIAYPDD